jgi:Sugar-specific transcriptional regulator TrmB
MIFSQHMKFHEYFRELWFSEKEAEIYFSLYKLGMQPASTVAKYAGFERTYVYKVLIEFAQKNLVTVTTKWWVKYFFIPDISVLGSYVEDEEIKIQKLRKDFDVVALELKSHKKWAEQNIPKITLYEWAEGIKNCYNDIFHSLEKSGYRSCQLFASNTLNSRSGKSSIVDIYAWEFFDKMKAWGYQIEATLWNGIWLMETLWKVVDIDAIRDLPAANESIQILITWENVSIIIFREIPFGIKISSNELAQVFHFLLGHIQ